MFAPPESELRPPTGVASMLLLRDLETADRLELHPQVVVAGYTGRDRRAVEAHLVELEAQGIARPDVTPAFYAMPASLLAQSGATVRTGAWTSGEVEPVLVVTENGWWVGVGSDHTDRDLERSDIAASKRACPKVLSDGVVRYERLRDHWDETVLRSWADGELYQEGRLGELLAPAELVGRATRTYRGLPRELVLFMGTVPLREGRFIDAHEFSVELVSPVADVRITCSYRVERQSRGST